MGEVVDLPGYTKLDIEPDKVLSGAMGQLDRVLVLGFTPDGEMYVASSSGDMTTALWLATRFVHKLHAGHFG